MKSILAAIVSNWKLKALATALAVLLWVVVSGDQVVVSEETVAVEVVNRDESARLVAGPDPERVTVRFVGPRREFYGFLTDRPQVRLVIERVESDDGDFALTPAMVQLPRGSDVTAQDIRPSLVRLSFERLASRTVPVRVRLPERVVDRYVVADPISVTPATIDVAGTAEVVRQIEYLATAMVELTPEDTVFERVVHLDLRGLDGLRFSDTRVRVAGRLHPLVENVFREQPVRVPNGMRAQPPAVRLTLHGPRRLVEAVRPEAIRIGVPPDALPTPLPVDGADVQLDVLGVPEAVEWRLEPDQVRVYPLPEPDMGVEDGADGRG